jgi:hypothetical protein
VTRGGARIESVRGHADSEKDTVFIALVAVQRSKKRADLANYRIRALPRPYFARDASATVAHRARIAICATLFTRCFMGWVAEQTAEAAGRSHNESVWKASSREISSDASSKEQALLR